MNSKFKIPDYLNKAMEFDEGYFDMPLIECGENLVSIKDTFRNEGIKVYFSRHKAGDQRKIYWVRKGLIEPLLSAARELAEKGFYLRFEFAYRTTEGQKRMYRVSVRRTVKKFPEFDRETQLKIAGIYSAWNFATSAHVGGAAVDVKLVSFNGEDVDMGAKYWDTSSNITSNSHEMPTVAVQNRRILLSAMEKSGFANYPFEYWHFSMGDRIAAHIQRKQYAIYGPVDFNPIDQSIRFLSDEEQQKRFEV